MNLSALFNPLEQTVHNIDNELFDVIVELNVFDRMYLMMPSSYASLNYWFNL